MKPNHICKYSKCTLGKDGGPKHYYACDYCDATENWKSMACSPEHYKAYIEEVLAARAHGNKVDTLPNRTDMTKDEVKAIKRQPKKQLKAKVEKELRAYADESGEVDIAKAVDKINKENEDKGIV